MKWVSLNCMPYLDLEKMKEETRSDGFSVEDKKSFGDHRGSSTLETCVFAFIAVGVSPCLEVESRP